MKDCGVKGSDPSRVYFVKRKRRARCWKRALTLNGDYCSL